MRATELPVIEHTEFEMGFKCNLDLRSPNTNASPEFASWMEGLIGGPLSTEPSTGRVVLHTDASPWSDLIPN